MSTQPNEPDRAPTYQEALISLLRAMEADPISDIASNLLMEKLVHALLSRLFNSPDNNRVKVLLELGSLWTQVPKTLRATVFQGLSDVERGRLIQSLTEHGYTTLDLIPLLGVGERRLSALRALTRLPSEVQELAVCNQLTEAQLRPITQAWPDNSRVVALVGCLARHKPRVSQVRNWVKRMRQAETREPETMLLEVMRK